MEKVVHDYSSCGSLISFSAQTLSSERRPITVPNRTEPEGRKKEESRMVYGANVLSSAKVGEFLPSPLSSLPGRTVQTQYGAETDGEEPQETERGQDA